ncbi:MAG TPA: hypothetical protein DEB09_03295 [Candidatus Magasanikbacteria bacterium]|nr:hypothetical protein [Candidatus Magasanikbacteria bacterium]
MKYYKDKKLIIIIFLTVFSLVNIFGFLFFVEPVSAQAVTVTEDIPAKTSEVKMTIGAALTNSALGAVMSGAEYFIRRLAYDAATAAASASVGKKPVIFQEGFGTYLKNVGGDALADSINTFAQDTIGLNLCAPPNLNVQLNITLGLRSIYPPDPTGKGGPKPSCTWNQLEAGASAHGALVRDLANGDSNAWSKSFSTNFSVDNSDFGIAMGAIERVDNFRAAQEAGAQLSRLEGMGYKAITGLVSGNVKTPSQLVKKEVEAVGQSSQGQLTSGQIAGIYASKSAQILPMAIGTFTNTYISQLLNNVLTMGLFKDRSDDPTDTMSLGLTGDGYYNGPSFDYFKSTEATFSKLLTKTPIKQLATFDVATQFASCESGSIGVNNCVIDGKFQKVLQIAKTGRPMTIWEAIQGDILVGDLPLISPYRQVDNEDIENCRLEGYCYSNIQKLRKARILPLGFEIAALKASPDAPEKWKLKDVVLGFNDCPDPNPITGIIEANKDFPYCHLIDPNWIIKAPETRCAGEVYTNSLVENTGERMLECVDWQSCVLENEKGECAKYGYCTEEENIWKFNGNTCNEYYNTCKTFVSPDGIVSYLAKTLDYGECTDKSIGCLAYSTEKSNDSWVASYNAQGIDYKKNGRNQVIYFNQNINDYSSCGKSVSGCSGFFKAINNNGSFVNNYDKGNLTYLKKAPDYLGCYDTDFSVTSPQINWPQARPDLLKLPVKEECNNYAQVCLAEEMGCEMYTPTDKSPAIPGIVGQNFCDESCVGYDVYKQQETNFSPEVYPLYFIPTLGQSCNVAGCDEFVNLETNIKGGEGNEYYSYLKKCEKPEATNQATFYSWEGSETEGYILRSHRLATITSLDSSVVSSLSSVFGHTSAVVQGQFGVGSPLYGNMIKQDMEVNYESCNEERYNIMIKEPNSPLGSGLDCNALYDKDGNISYRLLSETVTVSADCHSMRKTRANFYVDTNIDSDGLCTKVMGKWDSDTNKCQRCYGGGEYSEGYCIYQAIAGESNVCGIEENGCRQYVGNNGNNTQIAFINTFEPMGTSTDLNLTKVNWEPATNLDVSAESTHVGLHSLRVALPAGGTEVKRKLEAGTMENSKWYELSFWAKGTSQNLSISLTQGSVINSFTVNSLTGSSTKVTVGDLWKYYKLGPIQFTGTSTDAYLTFTRSAVGTSQPGVYYLDNVVLQRLQDIDLRIENSWKTAEGYDVPQICDDNPFDAYPGQALGCKKYLDTDNDPVFLTAFERLCREEAVGCTPLFDTYNTIDIKTTSTYNLWCDNGANVSTTCTFVLGANELGKCSVAVGKTGCFVDSVVIPENYSLSSLTTLNARVATSTVIIPADTPSTTPIYLTDREKFRCADTKMGCQAVGIEDKLLATENTVSATHTESYILNNPENYTDTLCRDDLVGCQRFTSGQDSYLFKDPTKTGNKMCYYQPQTENTSASFGWFVQDVGYCHVGASDNSIRMSPTKECRSNDDCGTDNTCKETGTVPCYSDYLKIGGEYGVRANGSDGYDGMVGVCDRDSHNCTEFVDPSDASVDYPAGKPYYVINDNQITQGLNDCTSGVSQKIGCVLFDQTDNPNKNYDTVATYAESAAKNYDPVDPKSNNNNNANIVLKVVRDRVCGEWLACKTSFNFVDENNKLQQICYELGRCSATVPNQECTKWENNSGGVLDEEIYLNRDVSWMGNEFSGYSLYNKFQVSDLKFIVKKNADNSVDGVFLVHSEKDDTECYAVPPANNWTVDCSSGDGKNKGVCVDKVCVFNVGGTKNWSGTPVDNLNKYFSSSECKAPPESDSPFASAVVKGSALSEIEKIQDRTILVTRADGFNNAKYCQGDINCVCEYQKVTYKSGIDTDYFAIKNKVSWDGIFSTDVNQDIGEDSRNYVAGEPCSDIASLPAELRGYCSKISKKETHRGTYGFCLEPDKSRPLPGPQGGFECLTWLPLDVSGSELDVYNNYPEAGYYPTKEYDAPDGGGQVYCTNATGGDKGIVREDTDAYSLAALRLQENGGYTSFYKFFNDYYFNFNFGYSAACTCPGCIGNCNYTKVIEEDGLSYIHKGALNFLWGNQSGDVDYWNNLSYLYPMRILNIMSNGSINKDGVGFMKRLKMLITYWAWEKADGKPNPNYALLYLRNSKDWFSYVLALKATGKSEKLLTIADSTVSTQIDNPGYELDEPIYENQIKKIRFAPFIFPQIEDYGELVDFYGIKYNSKAAAISSDVWIDFDEIKSANGDCGLGAAFKGSLPEGWDWRCKKRSVDVRDIIDNTKDVGTLKSPEVYFFRGSMLSGSHIGDIRYVIFVVLWGDITDTTKSATDPNDQSNFETLANHVGGYFDPGDVYNTKNNSEGFWTDNEKTNMFYGSAVAFMDFDKVTGLMKGDKTLPWGVRSYGNSYDDEYIDIYFNNKHPDMAALVELKPHCTQLAAVVDEYGNNKAWTDRVWSNSVWSTNKWGDLEDTWKGLSKNTGKVPYASTLYDINSLTPDKLKTEVQALVYDEHESLPGNPLSCTMSLFRDAGTRDYIEYDILGLDKCSGYPTSFDNDWAERSVGGYSISEPITGGLYNLRFLFASVYNVKQQTANDSAVFSDLGSSKSTHNEFAHDQADELFNYDWPPQIYSLNPKTCWSKSDKNEAVICTAGDANDITVNRQTGLSRDYNADGVVDVTEKGQTNIQIGMGNFPATVNFFAWAHHNRMPISKIMVDWGDGFIQNEFIDGKYKNRKPICGQDVHECYIDTSSTAFTAIGGIKKSNAEGNGNIGLGLTCETDKDCPKWDDIGTSCIESRTENRFGNSDRACVEGYYEFTHHYSCGPDVDSDNLYYVRDLTDEEKAALARVGISETSQKQVCKFTPKVQVRDNWGHCNGSVDPANSVVADRDFSPIPNGLYSSVVRFGVIYNDCDSINNSPWTYYRGSIIVVPE